MLGGDKAAVAFHGDHRPVSVYQGRKSRNLLLTDRRVYPPSLPNENNGWYGTGAVATNDLIINDDGSVTIPEGVTTGEYYIGNVVTIEPGVYTCRQYGDGLDAAKTFIQNDENDYSNSFYGAGQLTITVNDTGYLRFLVVGNIENDAGKTVRAMCVAGSSIGEYEPYGTVADIITEPAESTKSGTALEFETSYNHTAEVSVDGKSEQKSYRGVNLWGIGDKTFTGTIQPYITADKKEYPAGQYVITADISSNGTDTAYCGLYLMNNNDLVGDWLSIGRGSGVHKKFTASAPFNRIFMYADGGFQASRDDTATFANIQLELGSTATPYEPYCGGIPAPNPDYPQPIESIKSVELVSRNADGSKSATRSIDLQGHELRSLPDGTRDELIVKRDGSVEMVQIGYLFRSTIGAMDNNEECPGWVICDGSLNEAIPSANKPVNCFCNIGYLKKSEKSIGVNTGSHTSTTGCIFFNTSSFGMTQSEMVAKYPNTYVEIYVKRDTPKVIPLPSIDPLPTYYPYTFIDGNGNDVSASVLVMPEE